ncbi:MAG: hypothetical protein JHC61_05335 [Burkholderiaceae bacterium]|nr:hypothetical protein [Burkholderiaceae bacterium]
MEKYEARHQYRYPACSLKRIEWEDAICLALGAYGLGRPDSRALIESHLPLINALYYSKATPEKAVEVVLMDLDPKYAVQLSPFSLEYVRNRWRTHAVRKAHPHRARLCPQ